MFTLYFFAPTVIQNLGDFYFLILYFGSLISGNLLSLMIYKHEPQYTAVGASGAVTGVLFAAILLQPYASIYFLLIPIGIPAFVFGVVYLLYSLYGMRKRTDNIGHAAHFGGAIGGYSLCLFIMPEVFYENTWMVIFLAIPILILLILMKMGKL
jgi:membrane associated rhomboid family serine protease